MEKNRSALKSLSSLSLTKETELNRTDSGSSLSTKMVLQRNEHMVPEYLIADEIDIVQEYLEKCVILNDRKGGKLWM